MVLVSTRIDKKAYDLLREISGKQGKSVYELLKIIIYDYISKYYKLDHVPLEIRVKRLEERVEKLENEIRNLKRPGGTSPGLKRYLR